MPQEPQFDLGELTRLYEDKSPVLFGQKAWKAFPALRDELLRKDRAIERLTKETHQWSKAERKDKARHEEEERKWKRQLDEAKGLLERYSKFHSRNDSSLGKRLHTEANAFLASFAGREDDVVVFDRDGSRTRVAHQEQPTQGEVKP